MPSSDQNTRRRISNRVVDGILAGHIIWDTEIRGFGIRCQRDPNNKTYMLKARIKGRQRWLTIGRHGSPWTPATARKEALQILAKIESGVDVASSRDADRNAPTLAHLCARYLSDYAEQHKKASSVCTDRRNIENHVLPALGSMRVIDINPADIDAFKLLVRSGKAGERAKRGQRGGAVVTGGPGIANRCLALLSKMFNLAEVWKYRTLNTNPCRHIQRYPEQKKERYLSHEELSRLADTLNAAESDQSESPYVIAAIRLLIFTGARLGEVLSLQWRWVDFDQAQLVLPDSKTGKKTIFLSAPALQVLAELPRLAKNPYVIAGNRHGANLVNIRKPWARIRKKANLEDVRLHDLRHSFASFGVASGHSLPIIGKLLGHTNVTTTERYAHLAADPIRLANEDIGKTIAAAMSGGKAKVTRKQAQ